MRYIPQKGEFFKIARNHTSLYFCLGRWENGSIKAVFLNRYNGLVRITTDLNLYEKAHIIEPLSVKYINQLYGYWYRK